jgi:hypothetical protein
MKITLKEKKEKCEEHILKGKSLSHVSAMYDEYDIGDLKYIINLYKRHSVCIKLNMMNYVIVKNKF